MDRLDKILKNFEGLGGVIQNVEIKYDQEKGLHLKVKNKSKEALVFCPSSLLVDINDVGANNDGLYISNPENYGANIQFLKRYFSFHFGKDAAKRFTDEWEQIKQLSEQEKVALRRIDLYSILIHDIEADKLEYMKKRISGIHCSPINGKYCFMPVVTFANHHPEGSDFIRLEEGAMHGMMVRGEFNGEIYANYNFGDPLQLFGSYGYCGDSEYAYSLPFEINKPDGGTLRIRREIDETNTDDGGIRWPIIKQEGADADISWFPLFYKKGPIFPVRIARMLSEKCGLPSDLIIYNIVKDNIQKLLETRALLKNSKNQFALSVADALDKQIQQIYGLR